MTDKLLKASDLSCSTIEYGSLCKQLLNECYNRIKSRNKHGIKEIYYQVPTVVPGYPLFDVSKVLRYIIKKLQMGKFKVYMHDTRLLIKWDFEQQLEEKKESTKKVTFKETKEVNEKPEKTNIGRLNKKTLESRVNQLTNIRNSQLFVYS